MSEIVTPTPGMRATLNTLEKILPSGPLGMYWGVGSFPIHGAVNWHFLRTPQGIAFGVENIAAPVHVEALRRVVTEALHGTDTVEQLVKLGYKSARKILTTPITNRNLVIQWAESLYNVGPVTNREINFPKGAADADVLADPSFQVWHINNNAVVAVTASGPLGSGDLKTKVLYVTPSARMPAILGPRHEISKAAFNAGSVTPVVAPKPTAVKKAATAAKKASAPSDGTKRVGRPRRDGFTVGSPEAELVKAAYATKKPVPDKIFDAMTPEGQKIEIERREKLQAGPAKRGPKPKSADAKVIPIGSSKKAAAKKVAPRRKLIRPQG